MLFSLIQKKEKEKNSSFSLCWCICAALFHPLFMAAAATAIFQNHHGDNNSDSNNEVSRQELQAAIAKAVELRALHAALTQGNSPANLRYPTSASPVLRPVSQFSAQDYPVFTPVS